MKQKQYIIVHDLGQIGYDRALERQTILLEDLIALKKRNRLVEEAHRTVPTHHFLFCEHDPVITMGRTGKESNLLLNPEELAGEQIEYRKTNRGGDITFHGPGQIVGYPIFDLEYFFTDVHRYVRYIEEAVIRTLENYNIHAIREKGYTGVWLPATVTQPQRKICAIGIHLSRWVSMHGFAFNINTDLDYFDKIIPCGISPSDRSVTSLSRELGRQVQIESVKKLLIDHFAQLFDFDYKWLKDE